MRAGRRAEKGTVSSDSFDAAVGDRTEGVSASAGSTGLLPRRRRPDHARSGHQGASTRRALAGLAKAGVHILRHTFCSHLAMRGATASAIQQLAGHADLTTQRYMHLSPAAIEDAMRLLDRRFVTVESGKTGEMLETGSTCSIRC